MRCFAQTDAAGTTLATLRGHRDEVNCVSFSREGNRIASGSADTSVRVYREVINGPWSLALLLSSSRSLSFLDASIADLRISTANKRVLDQHGATYSRRLKSRPGRESESSPTRETLAGNESVAGFQTKDVAICSVRVDSELDAKTLSLAADGGVPVGSPAPGASKLELRP